MSKHDPGPMNWTVLRVRTRSGQLKSGRTGRVIGFSCPNSHPGPNYEFPVPIQITSHPIVNAHMELRSICSQLQPPRILFHKSYTFHLLENLSNLYNRSVTSWEPAPLFAQTAMHYIGPRKGLGKVQDRYPNLQHVV